MTGPCPIQSHDAPALVPLTRIVLGPVTCGKRGLWTARLPAGFDFREQRKYTVTGSYIAAYQLS